jgi:4-hydroxy-2-oxoheptanedioate aldolase
MTVPTPRPPLASLLTQKHPLVGVIMKMNSPANIELSGHLGFDLVIIDTEHGIGGGADLDHHLRAADAAAVPAIVRVSTLNRTEIQHALDGGAAGVVVPQVESVQTATQAVRLSHYPPFGDRGLATSTRAGHQGTVVTATHLRAARENTVVVVQIESRAGVANADTILSVDGVSAVWIGLSDLSLDLSHWGEYDHPVVAEAIDAILQAADRAGVPLMVIADKEPDGQRWSERGAQVLLINLLSALTRGLRELHDSHRRTAQSEGASHV